MPPREGREGGRSSPNAILADLDVCAYCTQIAQLRNAAH